jgi:hypothetical protein
VHQKARISKVGNRYIRRALSMPALTAVRFAPHLRAFYLHLQARGKCKMVALVAVMRKLLHAIFGMLKYDAPFDGPSSVRLSPSPRRPRSPVLRHHPILIQRKGFDFFCLRFNRESKARYRCSGLAARINSCLSRTSNSPRTFPWLIRSLPRLTGSLNRRGPALPGLK